MAVLNITYEDKEGLQNDASVPRKNKATDDDFNEIKQVVNNNATELNTAQENIENLEEQQGDSNAEIIQLKNRTSALEADNTTNKANIQSLQADNTQNKTDITKIKQNIQSLQQEQQTQNKNISNLQEDNTKNKGDITELQQNKETVNTQLETLQEEIKELEQDVKANAIIEETEQAKSLHIDDASGARGRLDVLGNVEQEATETGVNKFNLGEDKQNRIGLEVTIDKSKVTINGTTTGQGYIWTGGLEIDAYYKSIGVFKAGTYKWFLKSDPQKTSGDGTLAFYIRDQSKAEIKSLTYKSTSSVTFTLTEDKELFVNAFANSAGMVFNNFEVLFQLQDNSIETENYEEFIPNSPSIDYPSSLKILGDNTNEFDYKNAEYILGYVDTTMKKIIASDSTRQHYFSYLKCNPNTTYTISKEIGKSFRVGTFSQKPAVGVAYNNTVANHTARSITITTGENDNYIGFVCFSKESGDVGTYLDMYSTVKVEKGSIATSYSPYGQGSTAVRIINNNILDSSNYKEETISGRTLTINQNKNVVINGANANPSNFEYVINLKVERDTYITIRRLSGRFSGGEVQFVFISSLQDVQDVKTAILNSTTDVSTVKLTNGNTYSIARISVRQNVNCENLELGLEIKTINNNEFEEHQEQSYILDIQQPMLTGDYFDLDRKKEVHIWLPVDLDGVQNTAAYKHKTIENAERSFFQFSVTGKGNGVTGRADSIYCNKLKAFEGTANNAINQECVWNETGQYFYISINKDRLETDNIEGMNKFLQTNPMQVYCTRAEKLELDLTESQIQVLEKLNKLRLYKGVNNIFTTEDIALLQAEYGVDIQTKINNVISTQLSQIGGN